MKKTQTQQREAGSAGGAPRALRVALLRDDHLGDMILTTGAARCLAAAGHEVTVGGPAAWSGVWENNPHVRYVPLEEVADMARRGGWLELGRWLRRQRFDAVFVLKPARRLLLASALSGAPMRYCQMGRLWGRLTRHRCLRTRLLTTPRHMADVWLDGCRALGALVDDGHPRLYLSRAERSETRERIAGRFGRVSFVVVHPFHGGSSCNWTPERYAQLAERIVAELDVDVLVTGLPGERARAEAAFGRLPPARVWVSCGEMSLRQLFAAVEAASAVVSSSTGALHIASALDRPSVTLFCPDPRVGPVLWGSFAPLARDVSPPPNACLRSKNPRVRDCGFAQGPFPADVFENLRAVLGACAQRLALENMP